MAVFCPISGRLARPRLELYKRNYNNATGRHAIWYGWSLTILAVLPDLRGKASWPTQRWLDLAWLAALALLLAYTFSVYRSGRFCAYLGTDFRGYYAAAQIVRQRGFAAVYSQATQEFYQANLPHQCPDSTSAPPLLKVSMPYLPAFVVVFLPLTFLDFTTAYEVWVLLNLAGLLVYLLYLIAALGERASLLRSLQWMLCVPLFSNLVLGQMNLVLVVCLGQFVLSILVGRRFLGGFWLGGMLMKPHALILLLPGLVIRKDWKPLLGFTGSALAILSISTLLAGWDGLGSSVQMAAEFAGPLIQTGPAMMNFRALALYLENILPVWGAWAVAICGMAMAAGLALYLWWRHYLATGPGFVLLVVATLAATFAVTWHSHFYLLMLLIPLVLFLDLKGVIPPAWRWFWIAGPPLLYLLLYLANPSQARSWFGLGMLAINLYILAWSAQRLRNARRNPV